MSSSKTLRLRGVYPIFLFQREQCSVRCVNLSDDTIINVEEIESYGNTMGYSSVDRLYTLKPYYKRDYPKSYHIRTCDDYVPYDGGTRVYNYADYYYDSMFDSGFVKIDGEGELKEWKLISDNGETIRWELNRTGYVYDKNGERLFIGIRNVPFNPSSGTFTEEFKESPLIISKILLLPVLPVEVVP